ncbi:MAG: Gfo/Idh/MocA family protein [Candidatus Hodarchaeota archaeon]
MKPEKVPVAIVGTGEIGLFRGIIAKALPEYHLVCVVEKNQIMAKLVSKQLGIPYYTRYKDAVKKQDFKAVILSTPEHTHYNLVMEILADGKHIFCEKPLSTSLARSQEMLQKAQQLNIIHQVGYTLRYHPIFMKTKELIDSNTLGSINYIKVIGHTSEVIKPEKRSERKDRTKRFGIYGSFSVHYIDLMLWFMGKVTQVFSYANRMFSSTLDDFVLAICRFENGAIGNLDIGWSHHGIEKNFVAISLTGTNGTLQVDIDHIEIYLEEGCNGLKTGSNTIYNSQLGISVGYELGGKNLSPEMERFAAAILNGHSATPDWNDGYRVDELVEALNRSILQNTQIALPLSEEI